MNADSDVIQFANRLAPDERREFLGIVKIIQAEAFAAGLAQAETNLAQRVMEVPFLREHFAAAVLRHHIGTQSQTELTT